MKKISEIDALVLGKKLIEFVELGGTVLFQGNHYEYNTFDVTHISKLSDLPGYVDRARKSKIESLEQREKQASFRLMEAKKELAALR